VLTTVKDTLARLSVYTVPSPEVSYTSLLPHFLPPRTSLPHTLVMIALDWTHPWTFVEDLETWLQWVESWAKGDGSRELEIVREECRERRERVCLNLTHLVLTSFVLLYSASTFTTLHRTIIRPNSRDVDAVQLYFTPFRSWGVHPQRVGHSHHHHVHQGGLDRRRRRSRGRCVRDGWNG
jgi:hypothetical protein